MFIAFPKYGSTVNRWTSVREKIVVFDTDDGVVESVDKSDFLFCVGLDIKNIDLGEARILGYSFIQELNYHMFGSEYVSPDGNIKYMNWNFESTVYPKFLLSCNDISLQGTKIQMKDIVYPFVFRNYCILRCYTFNNKYNWHSVAFDGRGSFICSWSENMSYCKGDRKVAVTVDTCSEV